MADKIKVDVALYGSLARFGNGKYVAQLEVELAPGSREADLLSRIGISDSERGYLFINAMLCQVPGLTVGQGEILHDGDHVGIFSIDRMWPYQYRDGVRMSESLTRALEVHGAMHHTYTQVSDEPRSKS